MSRLSIIPTPFLNRELLLNSLDCLNIKYSIHENKIITMRKDYYGNQYFEFSYGKWVFIADTDVIYSPFEQPLVNDFLRSVIFQYKEEERKLQEKLEVLRQEKIQQEAYEISAAIAKEEQRVLEEIKRLEAQKIKIEEEKKAYVESRKQEIIEKAKKNGYTVKEKIIGKKVQIVLVRQTY